jgi:hypothetical protein
MKHNAWRIYFILCIIILIYPSLGEDNAISYYLSQGNQEYFRGNYSGAIFWYDKAIESGYHPNSPIISTTEVSVPYGYGMRYNEKSNFNNTFYVSAEPIGIAPSEQDFILNFDITNPNNMEMRIKDIYINVVDYCQIENVTIAPYAAAGHTRQYFCNIEPEIRSYRCLKNNNSYDYIKLSSKELENFGIHVKSNTTGIYRLQISLDYSYGSNIGRIISNVPEPIGFFDPSTARPIR